MSQGGSAPFVSRKQSEPINVHNVSGLEQGGGVFTRLHPQQRRLASAGQRGTRGKERRGGQGMENARRNSGGGGGGEGGGSNLNHRICHTASFPPSFSFISIPALFLPVRGGAGRNYRNAAGVFPTFAPV